MILPNSSEFVGAAKLTWQQQMKSAVRTPEELAHRLEIPLETISRDQSQGSFPLFVPLPFLARMEPGNPHDPLLRQVLPVAEEELLDARGRKDPNHESSFVAAPGLIRKYGDRALIVVNGICAVHCRYCFRRHFPYDELGSSAANWEKAVQAISKDPTIKEVILSGGDPLTVVDEKLARLLQRLETINHVARIRIHSRLPIVIPERVTDQLIQAVSQSKHEFIIVVHCNHANEIDASVERAIVKLQRVCKAILNQAVLLRGVNDTVEDQIALSESLVSARIVPYYLHQFDEVQGAMHFKVPAAEGIRLIEQMRARVSGYLVPRYVKEIPGEPNKTRLA